MKKKYNILLIEPAFSSSREAVLKGSHLINTDINLYYAFGLDYFDSSWADKYTLGNFKFNYTKNNLVENIRLFENQHNIKFDGLICYLDSSIQFVNEACHQLNLPVISSYRGKTIRNKSKVRNILNENNIDTDIWCKNIKSESELNLCIKEGIVYPIIAKPSEMMASIGVVKINSNEELIEWFPKILKVDFEGENLRERYGDIENSVSLETYIVGDEYSAESIVVGGEIFIFGLTKKFTTTGIYSDELGHQAPANDLTPEALSNIKNYIKETHKALKFQNTITHTEFKMFSDRPIIIEINPRLAGDYIYRLHEKVSNISTLDYMILTSINQIPKNINKINLSNKTESWAVLFSYETEHARVLNVNQFESSENISFEQVNYCDKGEIFFKPIEIYGNRTGAIIAQSLNLLPINKFKNNYQSEKAISHLQSENINLGVFHAQELDLIKMLEIENEVWHKNHATSLETLKKRFEANKSEHLVCFDLKNKNLVGFFTLLKVQISEIDLLSNWNNLASLALTTYKTRQDKTRQDKTRQDKTRQDFIICGLSMTVSESAPKNTGLTLMKGALAYSKLIGAKELCYTTRVPGFQKWNENKKGNIQDYLEEVISEKITEPILKIALKSGGKIEKIIATYFNPPESKDFGIMIKHELSNEK